MRLSNSLAVPLAALALLVAVCVVPTVVSAQRGRTTPAPPALPALSMTCPMHPDVVEERPGTCPLCKMNLVPVRLDSAWMCPVHSVVTESKAGTCRICGRDLIQVTVALTWGCRNERVDHLEPGVCSDGTPRIARRTLRPHGNHNPQHGGQFFMAPDNWHHLEGTYPSERVFRLYLYDDYARALPPSKLKDVKARIVTREKFDPNTRQSTELAAFPLTISRNRAHMEARIDPTTLPASMTAKVRLKPDGPEYRFDFTFSSVTKDPNPPATTTRPTARVTRPARTQARATASAPVKPPPDSTTPPQPAAAPEANPGLVPLPIPEAVPEILAQLKTRNEEIRELIARGDFGAVWVPAFQAKDLAVALESKLPGVATPTRQAGEPALRNVVRTAWLLDAVGDVGNRQQIEEAYSAFTAAVSQVLTAFSGAL